MLAVPEERVRRKTGVERGEGGVGIEDVRGLGLLRGLLDHALLGVLHAGDFGVFGTAGAMPVCVGRVSEGYLVAPRYRTVLPLGVECRGGSAGVRVESEVPGRDVAVEAKLRRGSWGGEWGSDGDDDRSSAFHGGPRISC